MVSATRLGLAVALAALVTLTGIEPKGTRHVSRTKLMGADRAVLALIAIVLVIAAFAARGG